MEDRKGDFRIYIISVFFLACTTGGGVFLCMYVLLPDSESIPWYLFAGMTLVAIPWFCWFFIFLYRCCRPINVQFDENHQNYGKGTIGTPKSAMATNVTSPRYAKSSDDSPVGGGGGGERHVQFGAVVEMGDGFGGGEQEQHLHNEENVADKLHESNEGGQAVPSLVIVK